MTDLKSLSLMRTAKLFLSVLLLALGSFAFAAPPEEVVIERVVSPAVDAVLQLPRTNPKHYVEAISALIGLEEINAAEPIAAEFAALELAEAQMVELVSQVGTARLVRMARIFPTTADLVDQCLATTDRIRKSPETINQLIQQVTDGTPDSQIEALQSLRQLGPLGVVKCLDAIRQSNDSTEQAKLREALVAMEPGSVPFLCAAVNDSNASVQTQAVYALGRLAELDHLHSPLAAALMARPALLEPAESKLGGAARWSYQQLTGRPIRQSESLNLLERIIGTLLDGPPPFAMNELNQIVWPGSGEKPFEFVDAQSVAMRLASQLARDEIAIAGSMATTKQKRQALLLTLEATGNSTQLGSLSISELSNCLQECLVKPYPAAATICCDELGKRADSIALISSGGSHSALANALSASHSSVRFAALQAIMQINPETPFPGSSRVVKSLIFFASSRGERVAVVAMPQISRASEMASMLAPLGYKALPYHSGKEAIEKLIDTPDVELALIDLEIIRPNIRETLFRLRRTASGGSLPVALLSPVGRQAEAETLAVEHRPTGGLMISTPRPVTPEAVENLANRLDKLRNAKVADLETRQAQAKQARDWIRGLLAKGPSFYHLGNHRIALEALLNDPTDQSTSQTLAELGTPSSQAELANRASLRGMPIEARQAAAEAFKTSIEKHGLLLSRDQILLQYDRYNASEFSDEATQQVLSSLLDAIESQKQ